MEWQFEVFRRKRTDWVISWKENKIRWVIFYYLVGLVVSCLVFFVGESLFPLPLPRFTKSMLVLVVIPLATIACSIAYQFRRSPTPGPRT